MEKKINWRFKKLEYKLMEEYLAEMAMKGWFPSEIKENKATFIPTEPRQIKFCVNIAANSKTSFHNSDNEILEQNKEFCEKLGWHFITSYDQMQFYYAEKHENTYPLHSDIEIEQKLVINNIWKKEIYKNVFYLVLIISSIIFIYMIRHIFDYKILVDGTSSINLLIFVPITYVIAFASIINNFFWYFKAKENIGLKEKKSLKLVKFRNALSDSGGYIMTAISSLILVNSFFPRGALYNWTTKSSIILILVFAIVSSLAFNKFKERINKPTKNVFIFSVFLGIAILVYMMAQMSLSEEVNNPKGLQAVPEKYSIIKISDFSEIDEINDNSFFVRHSLLVPVSYKYFEYYQDDSQGVYISYNATTEYYKCINESIASVIYNGILDDYENEKQYYKKDIKSIPPEYWSSDKATLISSEIGDILLLLKNNEIISIEVSEKLVNVFDYEFQVKVLEKFTNNN